MKGLQWGMEAEFQGLVFGVDEVGRGPWAGPVVAACACLSGEAVPNGLADSKLLKPERRQAISDSVKYAAIGSASVAEIDALNIRNATLLAMSRAILELARLMGHPAMVLVDGNMLPKLDFPARSIIGGDNLVASIAAASNVAKVHRDGVMKKLAESHPQYGWERNKGYGTAQHQAGMENHGITVHHRLSFKPVAKWAV